MHASSAERKILPAEIFAVVLDFSYESLDDWNSPTSRQIALQKRSQQSRIPCKLIELKFPNGLSA
jgi:hypothetical protein